MSYNTVEYIVQSKIIYYSKTILDYNWLIFVE